MHMECRSREQAVYARGKANDSSNDENRWNMVEHGVEYAGISVKRFVCVVVELGGCKRGTRAKQALTKRVGRQMQRRHFRKRSKVTANN